MSLVNTLILLLASLLMSSTSYGAIDVYDFDTESQRQRYHRLVDELRCPKCQNQNLAGSNSPIAADLRRELHRLLREGQTDGEIKAFMVARYGDFVLYQPPLKSTTLMLWLLPLILVVIGLTVVGLIIRKNRRLAREGGQQKPALSPQEQSRLDALLNPGKATDRLN